MVYWYRTVDSIASQMYPCQARNLQMYLFAGIFLLVENFRYRLEKTFNATFVNLIEIIVEIIRSEKIQKRK